MKDHARNSSSNLTRRDLLRTGSAALAASVLSTPLAWAAASDADITGRNSLKAHAHKHGLLTGFAVNVHLLRTDPVYTRILTEQASILVPELALKWVALRPAPDKFDFTDADTFVDFAHKHKIKLRGHTLAWHESIPSWFEATVTKENARHFLEEHIATVVGRYKGKMQSWDVVNEAILPKDKQPGGFRDSPWYKRLGPEYIDIAFRAARQADPKLILTYNDYGVEYDNEEDGERRKVILEFLRSLKTKGVPLDAVGIQSHIKAGSPSTIGKGLREYMAAVREMGLQIYLTELDVNEDDLAYNDVAKRDETIAATYRDFLNVALAEPSVKDLLIWGVGDSHTWLNDGPTHHRKQPNRPQRSLPFDNDYRPKPAFFAIRDAFDHRAKA
ncbi:endo-1,4-beta-xylanase [Granulicella sp. WH15]|uniref:endo-1,4-beta-xylanase n=1 Tax=Granulicella sp. WH15 TaxID=2602070 RepID=UPI0013A54B7F|nr:endo-1,4-beta-xylanase [Granulicella sp. WH15]